MIVCFHDVRFFKALCISAQDEAFRFHGDLEVYFLKQDTRNILQIFFMFNMSDWFSVITIKSVLMGKSSVSLLTSFLSVVWMEIKNDSEKKLPVSPQNGSRF